MVTTRIITPLKVSSRIDQVTSTPPATIHCTSGMICGLRGGQDVSEDENAQHRRQQQRAAGDDLRAAVADRPTEKAGNDSGKKRQEDDGERQPLSLSSC